MPETRSSGEPDVGNLHLRFDEGRGVLAAPSYSTGSEKAAYRDGMRRPVSGRDAVSSH
jgi:hypothetical protein